MTGQVRVSAHGAITRVVLSHPGKHNAMSRAMWRRLRTAFERIHADPACRCAVIEGEGESFCAGGDISEYAQFRFEEPTLRSFHEDDVWGGLNAILLCDVPVIAAIRGACMGAGVEIASACDLRIACASATFGAPIARLGFPMAPHEAELVVRALGEATARQFLLEAAVLDAQEMKARGFLQHLVPDEEMADRVQALARRVASLAPQAARLNKRTFRALRTAQVPDTRTSALEELAAAYRYAPAPEHREGVAAFMEKRNPEF
jgi:enoyl-CoA hydratase/carnithine racemase